MKISSSFSLLAIGVAIALPLSVSAQSTGTAAKPAAAAPTASAVAPSKLTLVDRKVGDGALAENGSPVAVHYTGYLWDATAPDNKGKKFDSSID
ncbi:MAG TPA: FKBP-type peptidyl-prolyl cis-trans isomerase, partial [Casimicrobium sp.]|nr:FKBP-type peptidyl-prolyl cis-trans isomerase [Casimicrobium sp.]